jgi:hypothetical protein
MREQRPLARDGVEGSRVVLKGVPIDGAAVARREAEQDADERRWGKS